MLVDELIREDRAGFGVAQNEVEMRNNWFSKNYEIIIVKLFHEVILLLAQDLRAQR